MYWCVIHTKSDRIQELVDYFNRQDNIHAFIPKIEKWFSNSKLREYQISCMFPDYIFLKTTMTKKEFNDQYAEVLKSIHRFAALLEYADIIALDPNETHFLEKLLDNQDIIKHSTGHITDSVLKVDSGPLVGMEYQVKKIDRHKRIAVLDCGMLGKHMKVPLEVISKT